MNLSRLIVTEFEGIVKTYIEQGKQFINEERKFSGIIIPIKGSFEFIFSDNSYVVDSTHPIFIPKGVNYHFVCKEYAESIVINFQATADNLKVQSLSPVSPAIAEDYYEQIVEIFSTINFSVHKLFALLYSFFDIIFSTDVNDNSELFVVRAEKIMEKNYHNINFYVSDIAKELNISEVYLRKLFVKKRGIPTNKYLIKLRMEKSRLFLMQGISVGEAASLVGYCDIYRFSRAFKNYFGYPPSILYKKMPLI